MGRKKKTEETAQQDMNQCNHSWGNILAAGRITEDEYAFLKGGMSVPEMFRRIESINRGDGTTGISGVFYALEENQISVAKAMQVIRRYLLSGEVECYKPATGESEANAIIGKLLAVCPADAPEVTEAKNYLHNCAPV